MFGVINNHEGHILFKTQSETTPKKRLFKVAVHFPRFPLMSLVHLNKGFVVLIRTECNKCAMTVTAGGGCRGRV